MLIVTVFLVLPAMYVAIGMLFESRVLRMPVGLTRTKLERLARQTAIWSAPILLCAISAGVVTVVARTTIWRQGAEVVWTGARAARPGGGLRIGGTRETAAVQWPEGYAWPVVELRPAGQGYAVASVWGGRGFLQVGGRYVNGVALAVGATAEVGGFAVEHVDHYFGYHHIRVRAADRVLIDRWLSLDTDRAFTVGGVAANPVSGLRASGKQAEAVMALRLEAWADQTVFVRQSDGAMRVLAADQSPSQAGAQSLNFSVPATVEVRWPNRRLPARASLAADQRLQLRFLPPWRSGSPLPPEKTPSGLPTELVVTAHPVPGDYAFQPPIGFAGDDPRVKVAVPALMTRAQQLREAADDFMVPGTRRVRVESDELPAPDIPVPLRVAGRPEESIWLDVHLVFNLLRWPILAVVFVVGIALWVLGSHRAAAVLWSRDIWTINGIGLTAWSLLNFRMLLAVRYAVDPRHLDTASVAGVATAAGALVVLPGFYFATVRLWRDFYQASDTRAKYVRFWKMNGYLLLVMVAVVVQVLLVRRLWSDLPMRLAPSAVGNQFFLIAGLALVGAVQNFYANMMGGAGGHLLGIGPPLHAARWLVQVKGSSFWKQMATCGPRYFWKDVAVIGTGMLVLAAFLGFFGRLSAMKATQEIVAPILLAWVAVFVWLGWRLAFPAGSRDSGMPWWRVTALSVILVAIPVFAAPVLLRDVGGVLAALAVFIPLGIIIATTRAWRPGVAICTVVLVGLGLSAWAFAVSVRLGPEWQVGLLERGLSRYVVFTEGGLAQKYLPSAEVPSGSPERVTARSLQGAIEHTWENASMIHEGGVWGRGFDGGPNRRSMVPQTALQYDSTYSFFVAAEHGVVGSVGLTLLYVCPVLLVVWSGRRRFDSGHALALIVAASFYGEALVHIGANLGAVPFTGRNLPLLAVLSLSDLFRWTLLLALMGQAVVWRAALREDDYSPRATSFLDPSAPASGESPAAVRRLVLAVGGLVLVAFVLMQGLPTAKNLTNVGLESPFGWDEYLRGVGDLIARGKVGWDDTKKEAVVAETGWVLDGSSLLEQEVARFNALPDDEKYEDVTRLNAALAGVSSLATYDNALGKLRQQWSDRISRRRPPLFRLTTEAVQDGGDATDSPTWQLEVNPEYNVRLSFKSADSAREVPTIRLSNRRRQARQTGGTCAQAGCGPRVGERQHRAGGG